MFLYCNMCFQTGIVYCLLPGDCGLPGSGWQYFALCPGSRDYGVSLTSA